MGDAKVESAVEVRIDAREQIGASAVDGVQAERAIGVELGKHRRTDEPQEEDQQPREDIEADQVEPIRAREPRGLERGGPQ